MKLLVYGGSGYLGSSLIDKLQKDCLISSISRKIQNKEGNCNNVKYLTELLDEKKITKSITDSDLIIFANGPSAQNCKTELFDYVKYFNKEIIKIKKLKKRNAKIIYFSTIHVYSNKTKKSSSEKSLLLSNNHYGVKNILCENILINNFTNEKKNIQIIRIANIFGLRNQINLSAKNSMFKIALNDFSFKTIKNSKIIIKSNPLEKRNYVSINDFVDFIEQSFIIKKLRFPLIINYASKKVINLKKIISIIKKQSLKLGIKNPIFILNKDIKESLVNYNFDLRYIEKYNFLPKIKIEDEILNSLTILSNCNDQK
tara:strand:+ start:41 stop:982 length:942 start_codon:yes stop_codon:yes gene_type:complete